MQSTDHHHHQAKNAGPETEADIRAMIGEAQAGRHRADRELLAALAGEDIAGKLSDAECSRLNRRIAQLIAAVRQKDFDAGWAAAIDYSVDYCEAFFAQNTKSH